jgi:methionine-rich copper-binding protein CopC
MKLEKSAPAADSTVKAPLSSVQIWFSEKPDMAVSKVTLTGPSGEVKLKNLHAMDKSLMAMVDGTAGPGKYTVSWASAGDDGHAQKGEFAFNVQ